MSRTNLALIAIVIGLAALSAKLYWDRVLMNVRAEFAREQIEIFDEMQHRALQAGPAEAASCLRYAVDYFPSGTKQLTGSKLDEIVENQRNDTARAIIGYLRTEAGEDFGEDPEAWIRKYAGQ